MNSVTRQKVVDLCRDNQIPIFEKNVYETCGADEAFLTGTNGARTPAAEIDGKVIGTGERRVRGLVERVTGG